MKNVFKSLISFAVFFQLACVSVPLPLKPAEPLGNHITFSSPTSSSFVFYVRGMVNNIPKTFVLDTGADETTLAEDDQNKNFPVVGRVKTAGASLTAQACDQVSTEHFAVAGIQRSGMKLLRCSKRANTLGMDMLYNQVISLNFTDASLNSIPIFPDNGLAKPMQRSRFRHIELPVDIMGVPGLAIFDTGAQFTVIDKSFVDAHREWFKSIRAPDIDITDISGQKMSAQFYTVSGDLRVGDLVFKNQIVSAVKFDETLKKYLDGAILYLGTNTIAAANWTFDLKNNLWLGALRVR